MTVTEGTNDIYCASFMDQSADTARKGRTLRALRLGIFIALAALGAPFKGTAAESFGSLTLVSIGPRIISPNGDNLNDATLFTFDSTLAGLPIETSVLDINGARVGSLHINPNRDDQLLWDGKDDSGNVLSAGIYIYSIKIGKNQATGTVVIAR